MRRRANRVTASGNPCGISAGWQSERRRSVVAERSRHDARLRSHSDGRGVLVAGAEVMPSCPDDPLSADDPIASTATTGSATSESLAPEETNGVDPVVTDRVVRHPSPRRPDLRGNGYPPELESPCALSTTSLVDSAWLRLDPYRHRRGRGLAQRRSRRPQPDMKSPRDRRGLAHAGPRRLAYVYHSGGSAGPLLCLPNRRKAPASRPPSTRCASR